MNRLNKFLIKDLINIVNFYLSLRTVDFSNDNTIKSLTKCHTLYISRFILGPREYTEDDPKVNSEKYEYITTVDLSLYNNISKVYFRYDDISKIDSNMNDVYIGVLSDGVYFGLYGIQMNYGSPEIHIYSSSNLNNLIEFFFCAEQLRA